DTDGVVQQCRGRGTAVAGKAILLERAGRDRSLLCRGVDAMHDMILRIGDEEIVRAGDCDRWRIDSIARIETCVERGGAEDLSVRIDLPDVVAVRIGRVDVALRVEGDIGDTADDRVRSVDS